jgi:hypothetical protein
MTPPATTIVGDIKTYNNIHYKIKKTSDLPAQISKKSLVVDIFYGKLQVKSMEKSLQP